MSSESYQDQHEGTVGKQAMKTIEKATDRTVFIAICKATYGAIYIYGNR